jgi:hypothetical protein
MLGQIFTYLQDHPFLGMFTSIFSGILGLSAQRSQKLSEAIGGSNEVIDTLTPYLSFFALGIGVAVGILTAILKVLQIIKERRNLKRGKKNDG